MPTNLQRKSNLITSFERWFQSSNKRFITTKRGLQLVSEQ